MTTGQKYGAWRVAKVDSMGKRATVICECGTVQQVAVEALESGASVGCGCTATPRSTSQPPTRGFASELSRAERQGSRKRHYGEGME